MHDPTFGLEGVIQVFNSKKLKFKNSYWAWRWINQYARVNKYKLRADKPLSTNIYTQLRGVISPKTMSSRELYEAIRFHTFSVKYLLRIRPNNVRYNLWGKPEGKVILQESQFAQEMLFKTHPKYALKKRVSKKQGIYTSKVPKYVKKK